MNVAILHYHLNRGGVTRVIENQLRALDAVASGQRQEPWRVALLYGGRCEGWNVALPGQLKSVRLSLHEVPQLDYDTIRPAPLATGALSDQLAAVLSRLGMRPEATTVHVHNHSVGKNVELPAALGSLAHLGYRLLLQIHDFAEDLRPANFCQFSQQAADAAPPSTWHGQLYPQAPHVHYAVLNGRDYRALSEAGVERRRLHLLPNPVPKIDELPSRQHSRRKLAEHFGIEPDQGFLLYPVRGIRRKNIGEALLYSRLAPPGTVVGLTLAPLNPAEVPIYTAWKETAAEFRLPCRFEVGGPGTLSYTECLAAADLMLTTSIAEGFGMVFLETWLTGNALIGRDLPEISSDFTRSGVWLDLLRPRLLAPVEWIGAETFRRRFAVAYERTLADYGRSAPPGLADRIRAKTCDELVDFGDLEESLQRQVIQAACESEADRGQLLACNPWLPGSLALRREEVTERVAWNQQKIESAFSLVPSGMRLRELYHELLAAAVAEGFAPQPLAHPDRILDRFLDVDRFRMLRS